jgi:hypothetical protein
VLARWLFIAILTVLALESPLRANRPSNNSSNLDQCLRSFNGLSQKLRQLRADEVQFAGLVLDNKTAFLDYDHACQNGTLQNAPDTTKAFLHDLLGILVYKSEPWCSGFRIGPESIITARHCLFTHAFPIPLDQLSFRLLGAPLVDIPIKSIITSDNMPIGEPDDNDDLHDYMILHTGKSSVTSRKSAADFRQGIPLHHWLAIVGLDFISYLLDLKQDLTKWPQAIRYSRFPGSQRLSPQDLSSPKSIPESCLLYRAPTAPGTSGAVVMGFDPPSKPGGLPHLFVGGMHLRSGDIVASDPDCGKFSGVNTGIALPDRALQVIRSVNGGGSSR